MLGKFSDRTVQLYARRLRRLVGETPGEGLPTKKLSTGQFFLPVLRFASY